MSALSSMHDLVARASQPIEQSLVVGFYDLTAYMQWSKQQSPLTVLNYLDRFFEQTGAIISKKGGLFVKTIGDAGLFVFPGDTDAHIEQAVQNMQAFRRQTNQWLARETDQMDVTVQMGWGTVACGPVGVKDDKKFDVYGETVNRVALLKPRQFCITNKLHAKLSTPTGQQFQHLDDGSWELRS